MQYQGGKSRIAAKLVAAIRQHCTETVIYEPFCGGAAMTLALLKGGFKVKASDNQADLILLWQAVVQDEVDVWADVTELEYATLKQVASPSARRGFVGFGSSFGGGWWAGFARRRASSGKPAKVQPFQESQRFIERFRAVVTGAAFVLADYTATPDHVAVYCDPPYRNTKPYKGQKPFDHVAFWQWVRNRSGATFVSELQGPDDIDIIWRQQHKSQNASNSPTTKATSKIIEREERLYYKLARL